MLARHLAETRPSLYLDLDLDLEPTATS
ncbi:MAG TPA: hypothetical protein VG759_15105 [Candidatus Angelobacter sp.]|nr:hypothetical protein [Candidatus Angelobacter sp.]